MVKPRLQKIEFRQRLYRRRYLVPNAVTLANMFCGFLTCIYAASGRFEKAVIAIGLAILLDGLDGRVARRLNATSRFGVEFDSFSDLVSFGVAPAVLMYHWCFKAQADEFGVLVTFIYLLCAASRLARFNISDPNLKSFTGLPTPGAAAAVVVAVNFAPALSPSFWVTTIGALLALSLAYLMVSRIEYLSVKTLRISGMNLWLRVGIGSLIALIWYNNQFGLLLLGYGYAFSGPLVACYRKLFPKRDLMAKVDVA
ncbi:MAG: CDP-diacylglycerol--serine O-phosphatidyltransferase [Oligoflexia bacterium]|nr:CDP-diacylglycerol--serine O-phosphatidyltransferase [Oligoflexia bacterium]